MKKKLTIEDAKGWKYLRDCANRSNLSPKCELCLRASLYDRSMMDDEWRRVCPECFAGKSVPQLSYPSKEIEKTVITSPPDGIPILSQFGAELPRMDRFGVLKTKDKKARKEIKELKEAIREVKIFLAVIKTLLINNHLVSELGFNEAVKFVKKRLK